MTLKRLIAATFMVVLAGSTSVVIAQDVALPNLAPQVVEITGDLSISFPSLSRQPLAGFNPPPRVPEIPTSRSPYIGEYKQENEDLPPSPLTPPDPPSMSSNSSRPPSSGMIEAGVGRYLNGYLRGTLAAPIGSSTLFLANADINGSGGRSPFSEYSEISTATNSQTGGIGIRSESGKLNLGFDANFGRHEYGLFGALTPGPNLDQKAPDRTVQKWKTEGFISSGASSGSYGQLRLTYGNSSIESEQVYSPSAPTNLPTIDENRFSVSASGGVHAASGKLSSDLFLSNQTYNTIDGVDVGPDLKVSSGNAAAGFSLQYSDRLSVAVAARVLGFRAEGDTPSSDDRELVYLAPDFRVGYIVSQGLSIAVANAPEFERSSNADMYRIAPFIEHGAAYQPTMAATNFFAEATYSSRRATLTGTMGWKDFQNYRVIEHDNASTAPYAVGYSNVSYEKASLFYARADAMLDLVSTLTTGITLDYRSGSLDANDGDIPYLSPFGLSSFVTFDPLDGEVLLTGSIRLESPRYRDREKTDEIGRVFSLGFEATYFVTDAAAAVVGVRNLGTKTEFWDNYEMDSGIFYSGLRWRW